MRGEKEQAAALFGEIGFEAIGKLGEKMDWKDGSSEKVLLHGLVAGIMAKINGGEFGEGLTVGIINEIIVGELAKIKDDQGNPLLSQMQCNGFLQVQVEF